MRILQNKFLYNYQDFLLLLARLVLVFIFLYLGWPKATQPAMAMHKFGTMDFPPFTGPVVGWK